MPDPRRPPSRHRASEYADEVVRARARGDAVTERLARGDLETVCRMTGASIETVLSDAAYRAAAQIPPHH